jgi:uncharacterized membrane protein YoaK (UPF0700 family)
MLLGMTVVTGLVDAVSILSLGRVFVANMTGNIVFVAFALAGAPGFSLSASLFALAGFLVGAAVGGVLITRVTGDRAALLRDGAAFELGLLAIALGVVAAVGPHLDAAARNAVAALLAMAMGMQNAVARRLAVPDLTTTVLTMTLTGIAADAPTTRRGAAFGRRLVAVATMFVGALVGAALVLHDNIAVALGIALGLIAVIAVAALVSARQPSAWRLSQS